MLMAAKIAAALQLFHPAFLADNLALARATAASSMITKEIQSHIS
jgi:hypothetical protein